MIGLFEVLADALSLEVDLAQVVRRFETSLGFGLAEQLDGVWNVLGLPVSVKLALGLKKLDYPNLRNIRLGNWGRYLHLLFLNLHLFFESGLDFRLELGEVLVQVRVDQFLYLVAVKLHQFLY